MSNLMNFHRLVPRLFPSLLLLAALSSAHAQITPSGDAYINTASPGTNYGAAVTLGVVSPAQTTFIQFDLSSIPAGYTGSSIAKATLKLYVSSVTTAGSFNVDLVNGSWTESTLTANNAPALGATIAASVPLTKSLARDYILIDITQALQDWLNGTPNDGIALVANSPFAATFESKENIKESHNAELDVVYAAGSGTITGVKTDAGSGLTGGGTSGTLNLSLITSCSSGQILVWNGSAWVCQTVKGTGTVTSVGSGLGLVGGPITTSGALAIDPTQVPLLNVANTFTGNQTVNGNLSATGVVTGSSYQIGSKLFAFGSAANSNAFLGFAGNTTMTGGANAAVGPNALSSDTTGYNNTANGSYALTSNTTGYNNTAVGVATLGFNDGGTDNTAVGANALSNSTTVNGVPGAYNTAIGSSALLANTSGQSNTATGYQAMHSSTTATANTAIGSVALYSNATGSYNTASGYGALYSNTTGYQNTAIGFNALPLDTTGPYNTAVGSYGGSVSDGSNITGLGNTFLGASAGMSTGYLNSGTAVGQGALVGANYATAVGSLAIVAQDNSLVLGSIAGLNGCFTPCASTQVGIGTPAPDSTLTVNGTADKPGGGSWAVFSDRRLKMLNGSFHSGLSQILKINPVRYRYKEENALGIHDAEDHVGLVAQEVQKVIPEAVTENSKGYLLVNNDPIIWAMLNAIKEQQKLIRRQEKQIREQRAQLATVVGQVGMLQTTLTTSLRSVSTARAASDEVKPRQARTISPIPRVAFAPADQQSIGQK